MEIICARSRAETEPTSFEDMRPLRSGNMTRKVKRACGCRREEVKGFGGSARSAVTSSLSVASFLNAGRWSFQL